MDTKLGARAVYSNAMYTVAGEAAANEAGISYEELIQTKVIRPLGLSNTGLSQHEMKKHSNYAMPYVAASFEDAQKGLFREGYLDDSVASQGPAGAMYSNVIDLVRWGNAVIHLGEQDGKQILNNSTIQETLTGHTIFQTNTISPDFPPVSAYGLGWVLNSYNGRTNYQHCKIGSRLMPIL
jgi:CubicO group peptidase (beta-lactamase class C family)